MTDYMNALQVKKEHIKITKKEHIEDSICEHCNDTMYGTDITDVTDDTNRKCICSYLCYKGNINGKDMWYKINNKEGFNLIIPVISEKQKEFVFLSNNELIKLNEDELNVYYNEMELYYFENPEEDSLQMDIMGEGDYDLSESEYSSDEDYVGSD